VAIHLAGRQVLAVTVDHERIGWHLDRGADRVINPPATSTV
jgi:hypothetical protein